MTTETAAVPAAEQKPEDQVQTPAQGAEAQTAAVDQAVDQQPLQTEEEKLWAEMMAVDEPKEAAKTVNGEVVSHDFEAASTESKEGGKNQPSEEADKQEKAAAEGTGPKPSEGSKDEDIWAKASPELRAAHDAEITALRKTANDAKAHAGRMKKQFEELQVSAKKGADTPSSKIVGDTLDKSLADFPEIAKPVKDALAPIAKQLETLTTAEQRRNAKLNDEVIQHIKSQQELLDAAHPGWEAEFIKGPKAKAFAGWIQDQPKRLRDIVFETNHEHIFDAQSAIEVFDAFKSAIAAAENPTPASPSGPTQELSAKRAAQLDGTTSPRSPGGPPLVQGIPKEGDPQAIWDAMPDDDADQRLRRRV